MIFSMNYDNVAPKAPASMNVAFSDRFCFEPAITGSGNELARNGESGK